MFNIRQYHNSADSDALCGGLSTGLNQCGKLEKAKKRRKLGRLRWGSNYFAVNHASSFQSVELSVWRQGGSTTGHALCIATAAPLPNNNKKLVLVYPKRLSARGYFPGLNHELQAFVSTNWCVHLDTVDGGKKNTWAVQICICNGKSDTQYVTAAEASPAFSPQASSFGTVMDKYFATRQITNIGAYARST